jgi:hypothetical protein
VLKLVESEHDMIMHVVCLKSFGECLLNGDHAISAEFRIYLPTPSPCM